MKNRSVCLVSLGCPKNLVDSEVMLGILKEDGYHLVSDEDDADILIVNTCGFISDAKKESVDEILRLAEYKKTGRCRLLIVTGCLTQRYKDELADELPEVDYFIGTGEYFRIADIIKNGAERIIVDKPVYIHDYNTPRILATPRYSAYIKIAEGCSNDCSYCTIPGIRGKFRSRGITSIVKEVENLALQGVKEINLIAQDTTSFGMDRDSKTIEELLRRLVKIEGIEWLRLLYLYPSKITDSLIKLIRDEKKMCKYFDIPIQHISKKILNAMNRTTTRDGITKLIQKIRDKIPDAIIRTSMIVGFPGETEDDFNELMDFVKGIKFDRLGVFKYSKEEGTPAYKMKNQVSDWVKEKRLRKIMHVQKKISLEHNKGIIGSVVRVLVEGVSDETDLLLKGRAVSQAPDIDGITYITSGTANAGDIVSVEITEAGEYDMAGEIMEEDKLLPRFKEMP
ncbi:MAG: 30S ribosomal protein S12 methylthiotransferase RimO [Deltaproteobacteria bacterium]|nr:30S ribosomal protein S12 methylthiotransferase RimO [Deltaproteobacteria bacterium]